ncbi:hypothetical protein SORBI_3002G186700 [Sorghum bicolor]|uniref:Uncharacterized protein n=1 Tax=Sorghum bicolor TaxID=4558 RepID=A0A1B6QC83_SORBI|nr:hypothetical protein SORBI_3002G186700 [Sorghum bicolor]
MANDSLLPSSSHRLPLAFTEPVTSASPTLAPAWPQPPCPCPRPLWGGRIPKAMPTPPLAPRSPGPPLPHSDPCQGRRTA